jgi:prepilin-type N-terminal cleavage/methylation domain-containing protein
MGASSNVDGYEEVKVWRWLRSDVEPLKNLRRIKGVRTRSLFAFCFVRFSRLANVESSSAHASRVLLGCCPSMFPSMLTSRRHHLHKARGFSLLELLICVAIIATLLAILVPALSRARKASYAAVCANNLKQIGVAFSLYVQDNADRLPAPQQMFTMNADWKFGGIDFVGVDRTPVASAMRPLNRYVDDRVGVAAKGESLFSCPADVGVWERRSTRNGEPGPSLLPARSCFQTFGNSYRANLLLLDKTSSGNHAAKPQDARAYALHEVINVHSKVLLAGDPVWYYATREPREIEAGFDASWHARMDMGNMLALDGSVRVENFKDNRGVSFVIEPR